jgi:DNA-binding NtrC family response regulator
VNRHQFEEIINAIDEPAILLNRDYVIVAANAEYMRRYNAQPRGNTCYAISHGYAVPCDQAGETCPLKQSLASRQRERVLHTHNTAMGKEHVDVELTPVTDPTSGEVEFFVEVMRTVKPVAHQGRAMIGFSPAFNQMLELLNRAAPSPITVLLQGESGTGKELAAEYLHLHGQRAHKPFVIVECSGLSETLFESELFGHEKGAFTGAINRKPGLIEEAHGGTLFLDEVGDIPLSIQVKLLRLIETGRYRAVGSVVEKQADFRLICASHKNIEQMVAAGTFRSDLYYRIAPFPIHLPALVERKADIAPLAEALLAQLPGSNGKQLGKRALSWLGRQRWPGNIRQLRNSLERALLLCDGEQIEPRHLNQPVQGQLQAKASQPIKPLAEVEQAYLQQALAQHNGDNKSLAAALGISERTLYRKLESL